MRGDGRPRRSAGTSVPIRARRPPIRPILLLLATVQAVLGARVLLRLARTANGQRIEPAPDPRPAGETVSVLVPVLDEVHRLGPCLDGLIAQGPEVAEIVIVDGGSTDGTQDLVHGYAARDGRVRFLDAAPVPPGINGKAHGLAFGASAALTTTWVLTIDADVRPNPGLVRAMLAHAKLTGVPALSAATLQDLSGAAEGLLHPALLTTLVYRFGIPGRATSRVGEVQANGQCFLVRRESLARSGGFAAVLGSVCEDVTLARAIAAFGDPVGFYETAGLVSVAMYASWQDAWQNWTRSLPTRDRFWGVAGRVGLAEVLLVQALPVPLAVGLRGWRDPAGRALWALNAGLAMTRLGVLAGTARAYRHRPWTYWLSPILDLPVAVRLIVSATQRRHTWRGRALVRSAGPSLGRSSGQGQRR